jgi:nitroreductase
MLLCYFYSKFQKIMIEGLIKKNRSFRRFHESERISAEQLKKWIELVRFCPSGRNMQPLKYFGVTDAKMNAGIFQHLAWAGYLTDWNGPAEGERPAAYIVVLQDKQISEQHFCDDGIAIQSILLGAVEDGYGGCIIGSINRAKVAKLLLLPENLEILWIIALGKPAEKVVIEDIQDNDVKYWRDKNGVHHVPKRKPDELIYCIK